MREDKISGMKKRTGFPITIAIILGVFLIAFLVLMGVWLKKSRVTSLSLGQPVADFSLTSYTGEIFNTADLRGKLVLVNFWSSWCLSCEEEGEALEAVWQQVKEDGEVVFLGVNYVDTEKEALAFLQKYDIHYPNGPDLGSHISRSFKVQAVPETYLIDREGNLAAIKIGAFLSPDEVLQFLAEAGY